MAASLLPILPVAIQELSIDIDDDSIALTQTDDDPDKDDNNDIKVEPLTFSDEDIAKFNPGI